MGSLIVLISNSFPYFPGEEFLRGEVENSKYFQRDNFVILPTSTNRKRIKTKHTVNDSILSKPSFFQLLRSFLKCFSRDWFYRELGSIYRTRKEVIKKVPYLIRNAIYIEYYRGRLQKYINAQKHASITFYAYWNANAAYATTLLNLKGKKLTTSSRAHGYDLYIERRPFNYMPFKEQFSQKFDALFVISEQAKNYVKENYFFKNVIVSRLGVDCSFPSEEISLRGIDPELNIVTISSCVPVKQLHIVSKAVLDFSKVYRGKVTWHHIGDGELRTELESSAKQRAPENLSVEFLGYMENDDVLNQLIAKNYDCIVNTSASEGVPVSIMEAMYRGATPIAPDVGGVRELIPSKDIGMLLPRVCNVSDVVNALNVFTGLSNKKRDQMRLNSQEHIKKKYNRDENYNALHAWLVKC